MGAPALTDQVTSNFLRTYGKVIRADEEKRQALFVASTEDRDRHGTVITIEAWKKRLKRFNANPIIAYMHHTSSSLFDSLPYDPDYIIGTGRAFIEDAKLFCEVTFQDGAKNNLAQKIWDKIVDQILRAMSVGFIPHDGHWGDPDDGEDSGTFYFTDVELVECSVVNIPSNFNALKRDLTGWINEYHPRQEKNISPTSTSNQLFMNQLAVAKAQVDFVKLI